MPELPFRHQEPDYSISACITAVEEARALQTMAERVGDSFDRAVAMIESMPAGGRVIITGVGKSGHIARKIAASMSSVCVN